MGRILHVGRFIWGTFRELNWYEQVSLLFILLLGVIALLMGAISSFLYSIVIVMWMFFAYIWERAYRQMQTLVKKLIDGGEEVLEIANELAGRFETDINAAYEQGYQDAKDGKQKELPLPSKEK